MTSRLSARHGTPVAGGRGTTRAFRSLAMGGCPPYRRWLAERGSTG
jgi:hypothetical protein